MRPETIEETAKRWGCNSDWVRKLARAGRIPGAFKHGQVWVIPNNVERPQQPRGRRWTAKAEKPEQMKG